jgi:lysophospholipase L1-like esterase
MTAPLPSVFVIGDSISMEYGPFLQTMLAGRFGYARKSGEEEALRDLDTPRGANGGDSQRVLAYLRALQDRGGWRADLLVLNCGLHDIKRNPATGERQVSPEGYRDNLRAILELLGELGVPLLWVRTTPVDDETHRAEEKTFIRLADDVEVYNRLADEVMAEAGVAVADLFSLTTSLGSPEQVIRDHVHFHEWVCRVQAAYLAGAIEMWFRSRP